MRILINKFSKVRSGVSLYSKYRKELTFENIRQCSRVKCDFNCLDVAGMMRETERQRERERDRETERQRDGGTERERERESERVRE